MAYNLWLAPGTELAVARQVARAVRTPEVRTLGLAVGDEVQVSMNLVAPLEVGPAEVWDRVAALAPVARAELVGLVPAACWTRAPEARWDRARPGPRSDHRGPPGRAPLSGSSARAPLRSGAGQVKITPL